METLKEQYEQIDYFLKHKQFENEFGCVRYIFAIVKNNIREVYEKEKRTEKRSKLQLDKKVMIKIEDSLPMKKHENVIHEANDISEFLEGVDLE